MPFAGAVVRHREEGSRHDAGVARACPAAGLPSAVPWVATGGMLDGLWHRSPGESVPAERGSVPFAGGWAWCWSGRAKEGHLVDALASRGDEGRGTLR